MNSKMQSKLVQLLEQADVPLVIDADGLSVFEGELDRLSGGQVLTGH